MTKPFFSEADCDMVHNNYLVNGPNPVRGISLDKANALLSEKSVAITEGPCTGKVFSPKQFVFARPIEKDSAESLLKEFVRFFNITGDKVRFNYTPTAIIELCAKAKKILGDIGC